MRRVVVIDDLGAILATVPHPEDMDPPEPGAPYFVGLAPLEGQQVHVMTVPGELQSSDGLLRLLSSYWVELTDSGARFVSR